MRSIVTGEYAQELLGLCRFCQDFEVMAVALRFFQQFGRGDFAREQNDTAIRDCLLHVQRNLNAVGVGEIDVAKKDTGLELRGDGESLSAIARTSHVVAVLLQNQLKRLQHYGFVFHYEDSY